MREAQDSAESKDPYSRLSVSRALDSSPKVGQEVSPQALKRGLILNGLWHEWNSCPSRNQRESELFRRLSSVLLSKSTYINIYNDRFKPLPQKTPPPEPADPKSP